MSFMEETEAMIKGLVQKKDQLDGLDPEQRVVMEEYIDRTVANAKRAAEVRDELSAMQGFELPELDHEDEEVSKSQMTDALRVLSVQVLEYDIMRYEKNLLQYPSTLEYTCEKGSLGYTEVLSRVLEAMVALDELRLALRRFGLAQGGGEDVEE